MARDNGLVNRLLDWKDDRPGIECYLMLTNSQIDDRTATLELCRRADFVQMNASKLERFSNVHGDVVGGINALRDRGLNSLVLTAGAKGIYAFLNDDWWHAPAYDVDCHSDQTLGDTVAGALCEGRHAVFDTESLVLTPFNEERA